MAIGITGDVLLEEGQSVEKVTHVFAPLSLIAERLAVSSKR
jgi:hypothetical protein